MGASLRSGPAFPTHSVPCGSPASGSCRSRGWGGDGRTPCRPFPSPRAAWGGRGRSPARRGTFCSPRPEDTERRWSAFAEVPGGGSEDGSGGRYLPVGVVVLLQGAFVRSGQDHEAAVLPGHSLHGGPGADDAVCRPEGEVVQILVHRVARRLLTCNDTSSSSCQGWGVQPRLG